MSLEKHRPTVFISYSHDSAKHKERVLALANRLRQDGIDASIDQYEESPSDGWPVWMETQLRNSDFILIICTDKYLKRVERREIPGKGLGVIWESVISYDYLYHAAMRNERFIPVLMEQSDPSDIPTPLRSVTFYRYDEDYKKLYSRLIKRPLINKPILGNIEDSTVEPAPRTKAPSKFSKEKWGSYLAGHQKQMGFGIAVLAAGKGTRFKTRRAKVLHEIAGKPLVSQVISAAGKVVPPSNIHIIVGYQADAVRAATEASGVQFIFQREQRGTGHAIMSAREQLKCYDDILVLSGDVPLIRPETIARLRDCHIQKKAYMTILTTELNDPFGYGRIIRSESDKDEVAAIVEQKSLSKDQHQEVREVNSGIYAFSTKPLFENIDRLTTNNAHQEFYLTDMAQLFFESGHKVIALKAADPMEVLGANTRQELAILDAELRRRKCGEMATAGVSIYRAETCVIDSDVEVGSDTIIEPFVQILGSTRIGSNCRIRSFSVISDSFIADNVLIRPGCVIDQSRIAEYAVLGPYAHLRPGSEVGEGAHVGNFVEMKRTRLGRGSKANHLTYLGDSEIGAGVNIGAGTITCNYDGVNKHLTVIEDGAFIGSDSTLVAPLRVGKGAYVAAGSTITDDVPPDALALGRSRQITKEAWARRRRDELAKAKAEK